MSLRRLQLDFIASRGIGRAAAVFAGLGAVAVLATGVEFNGLRTEAAGLELRLAVIAPGEEPKASGGAAANPALTREAQAVATQLATPWGAVLDDLEAAVRDSDNTIALLTIQPDRDTHHVTVIAEARSLTAALTYVQRLQQSKTLAHPLLDSHEVRGDVPERPVRVQITADWKLPS